MEKRLLALVLNGREGLPVRYWVINGGVTGQVRLRGVPECFMLLEGIAPEWLRCTYADLDCSRDESGSAMNSDTTPLTVSPSATSPRPSASRSSTCRVPSCVPPPVELLRSRLIADS